MPVRVDSTKLDKQIYAPGRRPLPMVHTSLKIMGFMCTQLHNMTVTDPSLMMENAAK